ncbi:coiled-coil domain-containing protein [Streptosporangium amethystogenes subsp. fukuiense]|uniref:Coiled-coil domain-containing protein n=1 Tax=Streptosporangium amethystogenes subsp. fukuiense TaxID=698418 RepID=A0ABW2TEF3_9ACTN
MSLIATFTLGAPTAGSAEPKPTEAKLRAELAKLGKKVDSLIEAYAAKRESLKKAQKAEAVAKQNLARAEDLYARAEKQVDSIVQLRYQSSTGGLPALLFADDMGGAAVMEQLTAQQSAHLQGFAESLERRKRATETAAKLTDDIGKEAREMQTQRDEVEDVIKDIKNKLDQLAPVGSGRRADGSWAPQLPTGADNITDRTRIMREAVKRRFDLPYSVGCYRSANDGGEHPLGRACDFMMSTGGTMPSAANLRLGDEIAAWAIKNKAKLGVKYVIWRQRINHGSGWRTMSNRGGITANHYDHPHISMY